VTERFEDYPFPLASGRIAILRLPINLSQEEAERMGEFLKALVVDREFYEETVVEE
jgi:hypothetical protein